MSTAQIILTQIQGLDPRALMAWGAKDLFGAGENKNNLGYLEFRATNNPNYRSIKINITLEFNDTYTVTAYTRYKMEKKIKAEFTDVYFDSLIDIIDKILG
jgi:hypothetical protein